MMSEAPRLAVRLRGEAAWFRLLTAAGRLERALKHNLRWNIQGLNDADGRLYKLFDISVFGKNNS